MAVIAPHPLATAMPWDLVAGGYAAEVAPVFAWFAQRALDLVGTVRETRVLDVATGPGTLAFCAAHAGAQVTAVDFAPEMLTQLRARAVKEGVTIDARIADAQALPFADASFDAAFTMFAVMFYADPARGLSELARVLAPGGVAVVATWPGKQDDPYRDMIWGAVREHYPDLPIGTASAPLGSEEDCRAQMLAAGFVDIAVHEFVHTLPFESTHATWEWMARATAPIALLRHQMGTERWALFDEKVRSRLTSALGQSAGAIRRWAYLTVGHKPGALGLGTMG